MKQRKRAAAKPQKKTGDRGLPIWPKGKPIPAFKSYEAEVKFWQSYDFEPTARSEWEELVYEPKATQKARQHVYRLRLDDQEMALLQARAKRRGVPASVILRELVRELAVRDGR